MEENGKLQFAASSIKKEQPKYENEFEKGLMNIKKQTENSQDVNVKKEQDEIKEQKQQENKSNIEWKNDTGGNDVKQASETAKHKLSEALEKKANSVVSVSREGENWTALVEIIDEEFLPGKNLESMNDIIGVYEVKLSSKGELLGWTKKSSRKRGNM